MPQENSFILNQSHEKLIGDFSSLFNGLQVPDRMALISFLEQHELGCFIKKDVALKLMTKSEANITRQQIFCLPVSENVSDGFIKNLSLFFRQEYCPVILYWTWELPDNKGYIALRINLEKHDNTIQLQTEILNPAGSHCAHIPILQMMVKLTIHLTSYRVFSVDSPDFDEPIIGDDIYWTALSLFLKLAQENLNYRNHFKRWSEKNKSMLLYMEEHLLSLVPYVHRNLFYIEQCLAICNMDTLRNFTNKLMPSRINLASLILSLQNISEIFPKWIQNITLINALRILVFGSILYNQNYAALNNLPLIFGLNYLTTSVRKKTPEGIANFLLFYLCRLVSTACQLAFSLYMAMPNNLTQQGIIAPRYILQCLTETIKEGIKLPIQMICLFLFIEFLRRQIMNTANNQSGFRAIAFFVTQFFMSFLEKGLFQFNHWSFPQYAG